MKKLIALLLVAALAMTLVACGKSGSNSMASGSQAPAVSSTGGVQVEEGLLEVTITLPASYFQDVENFAPATYAQENGFKKAIVEEDGSIAITMTKKKHSELISEMKSSVEQLLADLVEAEDTPYIKKVTATDGYKTVTVEVEKEGYESAFDMTPLLIGISAMMYQQYDGATPHCEVTIQDADSGETLNTVVYPDAMN